MVGSGPVEEAVVLGGLDLRAILDCSGEGEGFSLEWGWLSPIGCFVKGKPECDRSLVNSLDFNVFAGGVEVEVPGFVFEGLVLDGVDPPWPVGLEVLVYFVEGGPDDEPFASFFSGGLVDLMFDGFDLPSMRANELDEEFW